MQTEVSSRVALVTGGGRGMGLAIAQRLASDGFRVALGDLDVASAVSSAAGIASEHGDAIGVKLDVTSSESVQRCVDDVLNHLGRLDVLVNNAGILTLAPIEELDEDQWDAVLNVNLRGVYLCSRAAVPHLKEGGWGRIVSIASDAGKRGELYSAHYCASKFGVIGLTQVLGLELARTGVTANAVCPTITSTAMMQQFGTAMSAVSGDDVDSVLQQAVNDIPMGRPTAPEDVAAAVSFLCSDDASFFTGQSLNVTGGGWMM